MPPSSPSRLDHAESKVADRRPRIFQGDEGRLGDVQGQAAGHRLRRPGILRSRRAARRASSTRSSLREGDPDFAWQMPADEWDAISLNYTSGTTGDPKGVVYHHRGAYLLALGQRHHLRHGQASGLSVDAADVPLQRLVLSLDVVDRRRHPCLPARGARGADLRRHRDAQGHASVRRADRDVDAAQRRRRTRSSRCRMSSSSSPPPRRRRKRCWRR